MVIQKKILGATGVQTIFPEDPGVCSEFQLFFDGQTSGTISVSVDYGTGSSYVVGGDGVVDLSVPNRKALFLYCHPDKIVCTPSSGFSYNISMKQVYKP